MLFQNARTVQCVEAVKKSVGRGEGRNRWDLGVFTRKIWVSEDATVAKMVL